MPMALPSMDAYSSYAEYLERLAYRVVGRGAIGEDGAAVAAALDGQPSARLRDLVPLSARRAAGAFFTGRQLAQRAIEPYVPTLAGPAIVFDPACGVGDLLVACARHFPLGEGLAPTVDRWGARLHGFDIYPQFIRAAKARLVLLALSRGVNAAGADESVFTDAFPGLQFGDGLAEEQTRDAPSHIVLNPPYQKVPAPPECAWGSGKVSLAAIFFDEWLASAGPGTRIMAILPDVLRTGTLYARWRMAIEARATIESVQVFGAFDAWADVDVFVLRCAVKGGPASQQAAMWWDAPERAAGQRVGDHFDVHVGSVIPHRHPNLGPWHPYVHARLLPAWETYNVENGPQRRFSGRTFAPPFVAVRRTSAPRDKHRAVGTIVTGSQPVAVENHLLVLEPRQPSLERCKQLLTVLGDGRTDQWLDERIRCRHLVVGAVRDLSWLDAR